MTIKEKIQANWNKYDYSEQKKMKQYIDFVCTFIHGVSKTWKSKEELEQHLDWTKLRKEVTLRQYDETSGSADSISSMFYTMLYNELYSSNDCKYFDNIEFLIDRCNTKWTAWFLSDALTDGTRYINRYSDSHGIMLNSLLSICMLSDEKYGCCDSRLDTRFCELEVKLKDVFTV